MTHREAALEAVDLLLVLAKGQQVEFGPKDQVRKALAERYGQTGKPAQNKVGLPAKTGKASGQAPAGTQPRNAPRRPSAGFSLSRPSTLKGGPSST